MRSIPQKHFRGLIIFMSLFLSCSDKNYITDADFKDVYEKTINENKYLMVFISGGSSCEPCNDLTNDLRKNNIFRRNKGEYNFYRCNVNLKSNNFIQKILLPEIIPNMYIISNTGEIIAYNCGYINANTVEATIRDIRSGKYKLRQGNGQFLSDPNKTAEMQTYLLKANLLQLSNGPDSEILSYIDKAINIEPSFYSLYLKGKIENNDSLINLAKQYVKSPYQKIVFSDIINTIVDLKNNSSPILTVENKENLFCDKNGELSFFIRNDGVAPLVVLDITTSCDCINLDWDKKPIRPKDRREIKMTITKKTKNEYGDRYLHIRSNASNEIETVFIKK